MTALAFREHTWDQDIWRSVAEFNEYALKVRFEPNDVVLDVGAHIGAFSYLALDHGAGRVIAVEPDPENFLHLRHNLHLACRATDRAICISAACWRSDGWWPTVYYAGVASNTGGGNALGTDGVPTAALSFDSLARLAASVSPKGRIRLVKLDCEGSEWPILYTAMTLDLVDAIVGEYHSLEPRYFPAAGLQRPCDPEELGTHLRGWGFDFISAPTANSLGKFRAWRPGCDV